MSIDRSNHPRWLAPPGICLLLASGSLAFGQQPAGEKAQAEKPAAEPVVPRLLEEITVTAQKREENVQEVPLS